MIILDTNVVSEMMRPEPDENVLRWLDAQDVPDLVITSVTAAELRAGVAVMPAGRRRTHLAERVEAVITETFFGAVLPFDIGSGPHYAAVVAARRAVGRPITPLDAQIAATCLQHQAGLATKNGWDFGGLGVNVLTPWNG